MFLIISEIYLFLFRTHVKYHFLLRDDSFIFVDNGHDAKEIREALKTLPKAHYVVFMLYRSQISGNSRKDKSVTGYDKKPYLL